METRTQAARDFAIKAHGAQQYGPHPYSYHLDAVAALVAQFGEDFEIVAYLHDTVEDTATTLDEIEATFGSKIAECVSILTDETGENRKARKAKTNAKLAATTNILALTVKAADRLANLLECQRDTSGGKLQMYRREHSAFREAAYRDRLCDDLWSRIDSIILETE